MIMYVIVFYSRCSLVTIFEFLLKIKKTPFFRKFIMKTSLDRAIVPNDGQYKIYILIELDLLYHNNRQLAWTNPRDFEKPLSWKIEKEQQWNWHNTAFQLSLRYSHMTATDKCRRQQSKLFRMNMQSAVIL